VLSLKQNHSKFYRRVSGLFNKAEELDYESMVVRRQETHDYGHGRIEKREYTVLPVMYLYRYKQDWKDLQTFIQVISCRHLKTGELQKSVRYYISSVPLHQYKRICFAIREHWQVENGLHYKLDVGLREDACLIRRGYADQNLSVMRKIVLKLLNDETSVKGGVQLKRIKAALSTRYLKKVVGF
jgi:predicted transposase YbfD/YdcC